MYRIFSTRLNDWIKSNRRKPLVLQGARQVGKSTLVRMFSEENNLMLYEINLEKHRSLNKIFETLDLGKIVPELENILGEEIFDGQGLLFLDEIQATPHALAALHYFFEDRPTLPVIAAGSLLEFALANHDFSMPVGRVEYGYLSPLNFEEFLLAKKEDFLVSRIKAFKVGQAWSETLHQQVLSHYRDYLFVGGMPEAVKAFIDGQSKQRVRQLQHDIVDTYRDDFNKYASKVEIEKIQQIFAKIPFLIGKKIKCSEILPGERPHTVRHLIGLLEKAGIIHVVHHSHCNGIPISAEADLKIGKIYGLDVGLINQMLGYRWDVISKDIRVIQEGPLAEQFVCQELLHLAKRINSQSIFYWLREGRKGNAEVDFVVQHSSKIIPIEVKSGRSGALKSMHQMIEDKKLVGGIKVDLNIPSIQQVTHKVATGDGYSDLTFSLITVPPYLLENILDRPEIFRPLF